MLFLTTEAVEAEPSIPAAPAAKIPLLLKVLYTAFCCILIPFYWLKYGPANFLFFCDIALLLTLAALWLESSLLASMQAIAILLPQAVWIIDFASTAFAGKSLLGLTSYMFNSGIPLFVRGLSTFHIWLPILLVWLVWRLGYDRRALVLQALCGWAVLLICYFLLPAPPPAYPGQAVNINYVFGLSNTAPQPWMPPYLWFALIMLLLPLLAYLPTHLILSRLFARNREPTS